MPSSSALVFCGWGLLVAFFSVIGAPRLQARFGTARSLYVALTLFAADLAVIAIWPTNRTVLIVCVITAGIFIGINNTLTTQAVMIVSPVERPVASAAYGFVRFIGGGLAPFAAGHLVEHYNLHVPFALAVVTALAAVLVALHRARRAGQRRRGAERGRCPDRGRLRRRGRGGRRVRWGRWCGRRGAAGAMTPQVAGGSGARHLRVVAS